MVCRAYEGLLAAYVEAAGEFCAAASNLSDLTGRPIFKESLEKTNLARMKCMTAFDAVQHHRSDHRCQPHISVSVP